MTTAIAYIAIMISIACIAMLLNKGAGAAAGKNIFKSEYFWFALVFLYILLAEDFSVSQTLMFIAGGAAVAYYLFHLKMARAGRAKNTMEFMRRYNDDARVGKALTLIRGLSDKTQDEIQAIYDAADGDERADILFLLDKFQLLAVGAANGIYSKTIIAELLEHDVYVTYRNTKTLIEYARKQGGDKQAYVAFENLTEELTHRDLKSPSAGGVVYETLEKYMKRDNAGGKT